MDINRDIICLHDFEDYDRIALFDLERDVLITKSRKALESDSSEPINYDGWFWISQDGLFVLYRRGKTIIFKIGRQEFILDENTIVEVFGQLKERQLQVIRDGSVIFNTTYILKEVWDLSNDITPFVEEEDFDFGLFVSNISKSPERKIIIVEGNT